MIKLGVQANKLQNGGSTEALVNLNINGCFVVDGIRIVKGSKGSFISMPSRKGKGDDYVEIFHPNTKEGRANLSKQVLDQFKAGLNSAKIEAIPTSITVSVGKINNPTGNLVGMASVVFENDYKINDIRILKGSKGLFIAMPSRKKQDGTYVALCKPITAEFRKQMWTAIMDKYTAVSKSTASATGTEDSVSGYEPAPDEFAYYESIYGNGDEMTPVEDGGDIPF